MIKVNEEFYSSPYYFLLRDKGDKYSLYFSVEGTLTEARKKDEVIHFKKEKGSKVKKHIVKVAKEKKVKDTKTLKKDLEELVTADGSLSNSKIPILDPDLHPKKTMDQTVAASRITNDPISRGYRTYYGESVEMSEEDMSAAFGYEETKDMDGKETYKYFKDELEMSPDEAKDRTEQQGKDPSGKRDEKSKFRFKKVKTKDGKIKKIPDPNFISRQILPEIQKQKAIKMLEDILMNKKNDSKGLSKKENTSKEISTILKKNIKSLLKQMDREGITKKDILKYLDGE